MAKRYEGFDESCWAQGSFVCSACGYELPLDWQHEERPGVCFLDYVSPTDAEEIKRVVAEVYAEHFAPPAAHTE